MRHRIRVEAEAITDLWHEAQPIDDFGEGVSFFLTDTLNDDVSLAGKPGSGGLPRSIP